MPFYCAPTVLPIWFVCLIDVRLLMPLMCLMLFMLYALCKLRIKISHKWQPPYSRFVFSFFLRFNNLVTRISCWCTNKGFLRLACLLTQPLKNQFPIPCACLHELAHSNLFWSEEEHRKKGKQKPCLMFGILLPLVCGARSRQRCFHPWNVIRPSGVI